VVRARTGDQIAAVTVTVGDRVRTGQVLVRQAGEATEARARQAQAARTQAQRTVERLRPLHQAGAISDQEWEQALTQLELASADLAAARDALTLVSPLNGTVTEVIARPGMVPSSGDPLVRVADLSRLVVYLRVGAADAAEMTEGQPAQFGNTAVEGRVQRIALQADPATRLVEVEVAFPPTAGLIPGTLATVRIGVASREQAVQVPRAAVRDGAVWVVDAEGRASRGPWSSGCRAGRWWRSSPASIPANPWWWTEGRCSATARSSVSSMAARRRPAMFDFLPTLAVRRPVLATMLITVFLVLGCSAFMRLNTDLFPEVEFPVVSVITVYPGAGPEEIESQVTDRIEETISTLAAIDVLMSYSQENVSMVIVQFDLGVDVDQAAIDVRDRVEMVRGQMPVRRGDAGRPEVRHRRPAHHEPRAGGAAGRGRPVRAGGRRLARAASPCGRRGGHRDRGRTCPRG
jgi:RND family efflux transporter MFP subunit